MNRFVALAWMAALAGCSNVDVGVDEPKPQPFEVHVRVESDPGVAVAGAEISNGTKAVGRTDDAGAAKVFFQGKEGDQVELVVTCPPGYDSPSAPLSVSLRRMGSRAPQFSSRCAPTVRTVVVGVRAENGPNLPVLVLGRTVARTDASGAAVFTLHVKPSDQIEVTLSTAESGAEQLRPQSPTLTLVGRDRDDFIVLDQTFTVQAKRVQHHPRPVGPQPLSP